MRNDSSFIEESVIRILQEGPRDFNGILDGCHSLFPDELETMLVRIIDKEQVIKVEGKYLLVGAIKDRWAVVNRNWQENLDKAYRIFSVISEKIHLPHCLDYEWWFMHTSRELLAQKLIKESPLKLPDSIIFLGSPMLGAFVSMLVPDSRIFILDKSRATLDVLEGSLPDRINLVHYNVEDPLPDNLIGIAEMVFFDPPWYVEYYDLFFRRSLQLSFGNYSAISSVLFPVLTRPNSFRERREVLDLAMDYGLVLISLEPQVAQYATPEFERRALEVKEINVRNLRKGDLATFISAGELLPENIACKVEKFDWKEALIGKMKVKVKVKTNEPIFAYIPPEIIAIHGEEKTLSSVSRRDPLRDKIDLWTSTHIGIQVKGWVSVWKIVEGISNDRSPKEIISMVREEYLNNPSQLEKIKDEDINLVWAQLINLLSKD